ncbi:thiamine biosynthesis protein [Flavobacteriaceae bacterium (ex Bugula neritina AB1)]|nr:thiamine biosynthesis protein [Flavobacteriaceae bacterium (ex Bugula neritina AB1)]
MIRIIIVVLIVVFSISCSNNKELHLNYSNGQAFGTTFSVQFIDKKKQDYSTSYDSLITVINNSMSTYQYDSDISRINKGDTTVIIDNHFREVFLTSKKIYKETNGVFDPTIGILVNAWDFGPKGKITSLDSLKIDSLLVSVGLDKVSLKKSKIIKEQHATFLDFNAVAKGYAVDVFANFIENKGHENYLVEIGGEIRGKGTNIVKNKPWRIGVEDPNFDDTQSYSKVISLKDEAMATSGSYRKFKLDEHGNRFAHIIDAKTGYPHRSNLLSVSVLSKSCMEADAYATALMSMGLKRSKKFLKKHPNLKVFFIYEDDKKELKTLAMNGFPEN